MGDIDSTTDTEVHVHPKTQYSLGRTIWTSPHREVPPKPIQSTSLAVKRKSNIQIHSCKYFCMV